MKVPYFNKRIDKEFSAYLDEFEANVSSRMADNRAIPAAKKVFASLFPLFVLLRGLASSEYVRNPGRDAILSELKRDGDKGRFLRALSHFSVRQPFHRELALGLQRQTFTGYFDELFSDALLLLNSFYTCNYRGSLVAMRCMLEDLYRHLYYRDHPQEFLAITGEDTWDEWALGIRPQKLRDALRSADYLSVFVGLNSDFAPKTDTDASLFDLNDRLYAECSRSVHGSTESTLSAFKSNADLMPNAERAASVLRVAAAFVHMAIGFLGAAHIDHFLAFNEYERSMVLMAFQPAVRANFRRALNV